ncbi:transient receptor potential cation channel subfamily V member 1-like [Solea senegalensis]|uniref:Transient receptor potential cation channel subfamily V member 1-like n=1 Tax=Solea senegalensis TaxID=28829 RepID=A0AAV6SEY8_SOLSE|nr:transient receptor potential cation channel subfamily V member 1 [Solea senegalensis]KAG7515647.1 transient receptor potential cation channel subfamily V member 1-like [Solea senegalensis]
MKKSEKFGISMQTDDRTEEDKTCVGQESPGATMDTNHERRKEGKPELRYNANFYKMMHNIDTDSRTINYSRLFEDVASGDIKRLEGLYQYLQDTGKKLSDTLYQSEGKTALMKALLHLRDNKNDTVEVLLDISEKQGDIDQFVNAAYNNKYYNGQTALHIAIERRSLPYVKLLVSKGANIHAKADGKFFQPHDGPNFYFGELPLSLAACTNQADIVDFLMEKAKADPKLTDTHGNTVLHALVVVAAVKCEDNTEFVTSMYDRILKISDQLHLKLEDIKNKMGLTPLKLAAKTGKIGIFSHILKREFHNSHTKHLSRKFTEWVYGPVHSSLYDLASVDSCEDGSVMEILIYGSDIPNRHEMLETEPVSQMLEQKWKKFAGGMFVLNFLFYVAYLIIFTIVSYNKRDGNPPFQTEHTIKGYLYVSGQLVTLLANIYFFFIGIIDMRRKRPKLKTLLIDGYYEILFFVQGVLFLVTTALYVLGRHEYLGFMVMCLALSWVNVLYFSRGDRHMGIYSVMIQKMILSDILRFLFVYVVFLFGFSAAVVTLLIEPPVKNITQSSKGRIFSPVSPDEPCVKPTFRNISYTTLQLFKFTIGMGDMEFTEDYQYREVFYILLIGYIILTYILLLNMLIALMNRTVERITKDSASIWKLQRAITILDMEKRLPASLRRSFRCGVQKELGPAVGDDCRQCLRVEEVNWNKWNINLSKINEDPGCWDRSPQPASDAPLHTANTWRSRRGIFSGRRQRRQSTEMTPLSSMPV